MRSLSIRFIRDITLGVQATYWWVLGITIIGLFLRVNIALTHAPDLLLKSIPDDGFYYFQIARNLASGVGITADGIAPTNGFHPLWLFTIAPLWLFFNNYHAINAALIMASMFDALAAILLFRIVERLTARSEAGVLAMAIYFLNPFAMILSLNGLETAINVAMTALVAERFLALSSHSQLSLRNFVPLGLSIGGAILARTDNVFLMVGCAIMLLLRRTLSLQLRFKGLLLTGFVAGIITAPWFIWNYLTFGSFMQVSGVALPYIERQIFLRENPAAQSMSGTWNYVVQEVLLFNLFHRVGIFSGLGYWITWDFAAIPTMFMFALLIVGPLAVRETRQVLLRQYWQLGFLFIFVTLLLGYHILVRWVVREWYMLPVTWSIMLVLALGYHALLNLFSERVPWRRFHYSILVLACIFLFAHSQKFAALGMYPWQGGFYTLQASADRLPIGARVGISDSGFISYFSNKQVTNIDGIVNNAAAEAITEGRLMDYLVQNCVSYIYTQERYRRDYFFGPGFADRLEKYDDLYFKIKRTPAEEVVCHQLPPDGRIDLSSHSGQAYLVKGWSVAEQGSEGLWAAAPEASLQFSVDNPKAYLLRFRALPFNYEGAPAQKITLSLNNILIDTITMTSTNSFLEYSVPIPTTLVQSGLNTLSLQFSYATMPSEVGYGRDNRTLAARFSAFEFVAQK
jgi:hypothetical protein